MKVVGKLWSWCISWRFSISASGDVCHIKMCKKSIEWAAWA